MNTQLTKISETPITGLGGAGLPPVVIFTFSSPAAFLGGSYD